MYKLVSPRELTEIITGLLLKPELLGELDSPEKHRMFMADLGRVVAEHCGGLVNSVVLPGAEVTVPDGLPLNGQPVRYLGIKESIPHLLVEPDAPYLRSLKTSGCMQILKAGKNILELRKTALLMK